MKEAKGSISIFTLVTLLFMIGFLIISYANIINNSKSLKEQFSLIKEIYYKSNDNASYTDIYTDLRKKNRQNLTAYVDNSNILELEKTFASKLINYRIYGNTVDGVNLFNINSVTEFYDKNDKTLTGSCRKEGDIIISDRGNSMETSCYFNSNIKSLPAGTYTISVDVMIDNDDANKKVALGYKVNSTTRNTKYITLNSYKMWERVQWTFSLDSETTITGIQLQALGDSTNYRDLNVKFKNIQLEKGSTATDYVPCEIKSVGDKSKNLFNIDNYITQTLGGISYAAFDISNLEIGKQYTISSNLAITWVKISYNKDGYSSVEKSNIASGITKLTFTMARHSNISENTTQYLFIGIGTNGNSFATREQLNGYNIQIEEGSEATEYIPYGKYQISIRTQTNGKNLFNVDDFISKFNSFKISQYRTTKETFEGYNCIKVYGKLNAEGMELKYLKGTFKPNTQYTFSLDIYNIAYNNYVGIIGYIYYTDGTRDDFIGGTNTRKFNIWQRIEVTSNANKSVDYISFVFGEGKAYSYIKNWQIEEGKNATEYKTYKGQITNIYLDEPLRKAGDYADYIDFRSGKVVRNIKSVVFNRNRRMVCIQRWS